MLQESQSAVAEASYELPEHCVLLTRYFYPVTERSDAQLKAQMQAAEVVLARTIVRPLQPHQREALLCLLSDVVSGLAASPTVAFEKSFLVTSLNKGMFQIAAAEFHVFCYAEGKVQTRLWAKRKAESYLFSRGHLWFDD